MAKFGLIFSILAIFALSFFLKLEKGVYPVIFNFSILPLGILAYIEGIAVGLAGFFVCLLIFAFYAFFINVDFVSAMPTVFIFGITPVAFGVLRKISETKKTSLLKDLGNLENISRTLKDENIRLETDLKKLDEKVSEIVNLYEITKAMSATLLFSEIFQIFSEFLRKNFKFTVCKLILVDQSDKKGTVGKVYKIEMPETNNYMPEPKVATQELIDAEMLNEIYRTKRAVSYEDFIAIPLISQDEIIGILNVEGLQATDLERFLIVSRQFSLEIEKVRLYETVQELAITDGVTGIFVRRYFLEMLKEELERSLKHKFKLSFLMVDLDHFKERNDRFGHLVGDAILRETAKILKENVREIDLIGRYGGEEFSLFLPETDKTSAALVAERLRQAILEEDFKAYDEIVKMTISVGISTFPDDTKDLAELIELADTALYEAKAQGRNRVVAWR